VLLFAVGAFATAGQLLLTRAYAVERAPVVAAASYAGVLWAFLLDLIVFGETPTVWVFAGGGLVVLSSLYLALGSPGVRSAGSTPGEGPTSPPGPRP
jgi:drug/metabolite transporter (DMT)-like permease